MQIYSGAKLDLQSKSLGPALQEFAGYVRGHVEPAPGARIQISLSESGSRMAEAAVAAMPAAKAGFGIGYGHTPGVKPITGADFLAALRNKPKRTFMQAGFEDPSEFPAAWDVVARLASAATESGRGVMLFVHLTGWGVAGGDDGLRVDATFSRFQHSGTKMAASAGLRFVAPNLKDASVKTTIASAAKLLGLSFGKPVSTLATPEGPPVADSALAPPTPEARLVVLTAFGEVFARAAQRIEAKPEDLAHFPLLFTRSGGFDKRIADVLAKKKENVPLPSRLKRFMKERFREYAFDVSNGEQLWFRKAVAPTLDALLMFDKVHYSGLGKAFTAVWGVDFPSTAFGGSHAGLSGTRENIFWMFHEGWEQQVWAYTTSEELEKALGGCEQLLRRVLPALEEQARNLLVPVPAEVPAGTPQLGPMTAREAYAHARSLAQGWAPDAQCESIAAGANLAVRDQRGCGLDAGGRLQLHGRWLVKFVSRKREKFCLYAMPHTGTPWWNFYTVSRGGIPRWPAVIPGDDWIDSTRIAPLVFAEVEKHLDGRRLYDVLLTLASNNPYHRGRFVWAAHCMAFGDARGDRLDIHLSFDPISGELLEVTCR